jgi:hypothetical protein
VHLLTTKPLPPPSVLASSELQEAVCHRAGKDMHCLLDNNLSFRSASDIV